MKIIAGKDKGKSGVILRALPREDKVIVEGVALYKRHMKGSAGQIGRIIEKSRPIHVSNVMNVSAKKSKTVSDAPAKAKGSKK